MRSVDEVVLPGGITVPGLRLALRQARAVFAFLHGSRAMGPTVGTRTWMSPRGSSTTSGLGR